MAFLTKLLFLIKHPVLVIVTGNGRACAAEAIFQLLARHFGKGAVKKIQKLDWENVLRGEFLILDFDLAEDIPVQKFKFFLKKSKKPFLLVSAVGEIASDEVLFVGKRKDVAGAMNLAQILPKQGRLVLNIDDPPVREIRNKTKIPALTFGLSEADFWASDINIAREGTNFKINYKGNIVPVWLKGLFGKEQIYSALSALTIAVSLDINLVEASQHLTFYRSLPGRMRMIRGIKHTEILDNSVNVTLSSMIEALEILGKIPVSGRRIAVLGDVLGIGKWTIQLHELIVNKVMGSCDLLFTVGVRAKLIAQGVIGQGMPREKVFQFMEPVPAGLILQKELAQGDLVLVDGSKEVKMSKIVKEIKETKEIKR